MTPRERIEKLANEIQTESEEMMNKVETLSMQAMSGLILAKSLKEILPKASDKICEEIVAGWDRDGGIPGWPSTYKEGGLN